MSHLSSVLIDMQASALHSGTGTIVTITTTRDADDADESCLADNPDVMDRHHPLPPDDIIGPRGF